jgi:hypothetical protein
VPKIKEQLTCTDLLDQKKLEEWLALDGVTVDQWEAYKKKLLSPPNTLTKDNKPVTVKQFVGQCLSALGSKQGSVDARLKPYLEGMKGVKRVGERFKEVEMRFEYEPADRKLSVEDVVEIGRLRHLPNHRLAMEFGTMVRLIEEALKQLGA